MRFFSTTRPFLTPKHRNLATTITDLEVAVVAANGIGWTTAFITDPYISPGIRYSSVSSIVHVLLSVLPFYSFDFYSLTSDC